MRFLLIAKHLSNEIERINWILLYLVDADLTLNCVKEVTEKRNDLYYRLKTKTLNEKGKTTYLRNKESII